jgi:L-histidine N-alpha-methyltransferase
MHLRPTVSQTVRILDLDLEMTVTPDQTIWTESSYKFTRESIARDLADAGLALKSWHCDDRGQFGLAVAGAA